MLEKIKPSVERKWLIMFSGIIWSGVGVLLNWIASKWFYQFKTSETILALTVGPLLGFAIAFLGFSKLARKNIDRILAYPEKVCLFAFQRWQMYFLVAFMMGLGIFMRTTNIIPKFLLAPLYIGIGSALFLSSFVYYFNFSSE